MKDLWEELKAELEAADREEMRQMVALIKSQLVEIEQDGESYADFLERQGDIEFGDDK